MARLNNDGTMCAEIIAAEKWAKKELTNPQRSWAGKELKNKGKRCAKFVRRKRSKLSRRQLAKIDNDLNELRRSSSRAAEKTYSWRGSTYLQEDAPAKGATSHEVVYVDDEEDWEGFSDVEMDSAAGNHNRDEQRNGNRPHDRVGRDY